MASFPDWYTKFGGVIGRPFRSLDDDSIFKCVSQRPLVFIPSGMSWKVKEKKGKMETESIQIFLERKSIYKMSLLFHFLFWHGIMTLFLFRSRYQDTFRFMEININKLIMVISMRLE